MKQKLLIATIFICSLLVRIFSIWPYNIIIGFDQARDLFDARKIILDHDLRIIGPTAGNNPDLHHGVAYLYYLITPIFIGGGNPTIVAIWNSIFNAATVIIIYLLAKSLFKDKISATIAAIITGVSYYYVSYSSWLSNPTVTLLTVTLFFYGCYLYYKGKKWGLPFASFFLGLTIQFELFFLYLIPTGILGWLILRPKFPKIKLLIISLVSLVVATSTMVLTEIKFHFAGMKSILNAGQFVGGQEKADFFHLFVNFIRMRWEAFYLNFWPQNKNFGIYFGLFVLSFFVYEIIRYQNKSGIVKRNLFLILWLFSPVIMLLIGIHNAPWFLIGRPGAAILMASYIVSKIKPKFLIIPLVGLIVFANILAIKNDYGDGQKLLGPDNSAILSRQVAVMEYTYQKSGGKNFAIDTVTNPLYINAVWAWNYNWYSKTHGFEPTWLGGDQKHPYDTLAKASDQEVYQFLIMDETSRIPEVYRQNAINSMKKRSIFVEEKDFDGILVQMWQTKKTSAI